MSNDKLKVLIISHGHPSYSIGGAEVASYNLYRGIDGLDDCEAHYLARIGPPHNVHRDTPFMSLRQREREVMYYADDYDHFRLSNRDPAALRRDFSQYLKDLQPDVVHFHHFLGLGVECVYEVKRTLPNVPVVVTLHEFLSICHHHGQMVKTEGKRLCRRATPGDCALCFPDLSPGMFLRREMFLKSFFDQVDLFISPSEFLIERYVEWGLPRKKMRLLENGIDTGKIAPPRPIPSNGRRSRLGFFGQVTAFKGVDVALEAALRVPKSVWRDDAALMIFGGNLEGQPEAFRQRFETLLKSAGRRARFYGAYRSEELPDLMGDIDWLVVPSIWWENAPIVIQEAGLHGRPVICSNIGGMAEKVRHTKTGLHFRVGSVEDLVDRFVEVLTNPDLWQTMRTNIDQPLSYQAAAAQHVERYHALLAKQPGTRFYRGTGRTRTVSSQLVVNLRERRSGPLRRVG